MAPTTFGASGLFGGGERYPIELARAPAGLDGVDRELAQPVAPRSGSGGGAAGRRGTHHVRGAASQAAAPLVLDRFTWTACADRCLTAYRGVVT